MTVLRSLRRDVSTPPGASIRWRWALPFVVVTPMLVLASVVHRTSIIFPEGAALSFGVFVLAVPGWTISRWKLCVIPPLAACLGLGLTHLAIQKFWKEILAILCVVALLRAVHSLLAPSLSAALIPVVFHIQSWFYPLSVVTVCVTVTIVAMLLQRTDAGTNPQVVERQQTRKLVMFTVVAVAWVLIVTIARLPPATLAPPLFVSAFEAGQHFPGLHASTYRCILFGITGLIAVLLVQNLHWAPLAGVVSLGIALGLVALTREFHPPIMAISLLPLIVGHVVAWKFSLCLMIGAVGLTGLTFAMARLGAKEKEK